LLKLSIVLNNEVNMSALVSVAGSVATWGFRGAVAGFSVDLTRSLLTPGFDLRNTLINAVHGVAIGIIASTFGTPAAVGAFIFGATVSVFALFIENFAPDNHVFEYALKMRAAATLLGAVFGSVIGGVVA
jgi:hypothetical protein